MAGIFSILFSLKSRTHLYNIVLCVFFHRFANTMSDAFKQLYNKLRIACNLIGSIFAPVIIIRYLDRCQSRRSASPNGWNEWKT